MFKGLPASPGIVIGPAYVLNKRITEIKKEKREIESVEEELVRLKAGVERTKLDIMEIKEKIVYDIGNKEADIFNAYLLLLEDQNFTGKAEKIIKEETVNAEFALMKVLDYYLEFFNNISNSYLKEKSRDISGLVEKILKNITKLETKENKPEEKYIVIAGDLSPADTAEMDKSQVLGFVTESGGATSHTTIVARALEIPAVVGVRDITSSVNTGDTVILDGEKGFVVVNPSPKAMAAYREEQKKYQLRLKLLKSLKKLESITLDRRRVELNSNIEFPEEVGVAKSNNADGVGLFRTEFIYINRLNLPSEEEQFEIYKDVVEKMSPRPVTIRTLDIGGDKFLPYFKIPPEQNPYLGLRAIRLSMANLNIFRLQIRAILRASAFGKARIMFPMISVPEEIDEARAVLEDVKSELARKKVEFDANIKVGIMIEVPSAALLTDELAQKVDFFSIGTNDLIQYTLAVDRGNQAVARLYDSFNPAVLRLIKMTIDNAHKNNIHVGVCGEMGGDPFTAFVLVGLGIDELSVNAASMLSVKKMIRSVTFKDALETAEKAIKLNRASEVRAYVTSKLNQALAREKGEKK